jgi:hypothetical protein
MIPPFAGQSRSQKPGGSLYLVCRRNHTALVLLLLIVNNSGVSMTQRRSIIKALLDEHAYLLPRAPPLRRLLFEHGSRSASFRHLTSRLALRAARTAPPLYGCRAPRQARSIVIRPCTDIIRFSPICAELPIYEIPTLEDERPMAYHHDLESQLILQTALIEANRRYSDEEIARNAGLNRGRMTVYRFRTEDLDEYHTEHDRLKLDAPVAERLWRYLDNLGYMKSAAQGSNGYNNRAERLAVKAMKGFYNASDDETRKWMDEWGLQSRYFCYKPSFRRPGNIVKSKFEIELKDNDYLHATNTQYDTVSPRALRSFEQSKGFGFSKTGRLWFFLSEQMRQQPRIFCIHKYDIDEQNRICLMIGYVVESDRRFTSGVFKFRIGLVSIHRDQAQWDHQFPDDPYNPEDQVGNFAVPRTDRRTDSQDDRKKDNRVMFDEEIVNYLKPDLRAGIDDRALDSGETISRQPADADD